MKTKSVIYARVSTSLQDTQSQIDDLQRWADNNNYEIVKVFQETVSGYDVTKKRQELDNLKEYLDKSGVKHIITFELSRLGRSTLQTQIEIDYFTKRKVNIFFKKENLNSLSDEPIQL
jgi:DNA invertase Pin-like site-specific DNA recombinase